MFGSPCPLISRLNLSLPFGTPDDTDGWEIVFSLFWRGVLGIVLRIVTLSEGFAIPY